MLDKNTIKDRTAVFLPIKPKYANKIISGEKKVEFRKVEFKNNVNNLIIYASSPVKKIIAVCDVVRIRKNTPKELWKLYENVSGISYLEYNNYFKNKLFAIAIELENIHVLNEPLGISEFEETDFVPQSFMYMKNKTVANLKDNA